MKLNLNMNTIALSALLAPASGVNGNLGTASQSQHFNSKAARGLRGAIGVSTNSKDESKMELVHRQLDDTYDYVYLCAHPVDSDNGNDKYFWASMADSDGNIKGSCLLKIPETDDANGDPYCCHAQNADGGYSVEYSTDYNFLMQDPILVTDTSSEQYEICGENGGLACPDYDFDENEIAFSYVEVQYSNDSSGDDVGTRSMSKFVANGGYDCGLGDKLGTCGSGSNQVYGDFHVGKGDCLLPMVTLSQQCDGHYGYQCEPDYSDC